MAADNFEDSIRMAFVKIDRVIRGLAKTLSYNEKSTFRYIYTTRFTTGFTEHDAIEILRDLSHKEYMKLTIVNQEGALPYLVSCLFRNDFREIAAETIGNLAAADSHVIKSAIVNEDGALKGLVQSLFAVDNVGLQEQAARVFEELAILGDFKHKIVSEPGALEGLVMNMAERGKPGLQERAVEAMKKLTCPINWRKKRSSREDEAILKAIATRDGVLRSLARNLARRERPNLQVSAGLTLCNLAVSTDDSIKRKIGNEHGMLTGLVTCLTSYNGLIQESAANTLWYLAQEKDGLMKGKIAREHGALAGLVKCLYAVDEPDLQYAAIQALSTLAETEDDSLPDSLKQRIRVEQGFVRALERRLEHLDAKNKSKVLLRKAARRALRYLQRDLQK